MVFIKLVVCECAKVIPTNHSCWSGSLRGHTCEIAQSLVHNHLWPTFIRNYACVTQHTWLCIPDPPSFQCEKLGMVLGTRLLLVYVQYHISLTFPGRGNPATLSLVSGTAAWPPNLPSLHPLTAPYQQSLLAQMKTFGGFSATRLRYDPR